MVTKISVHFDMETGDPDDVMALCLLTTHPGFVVKLINLKNLL